MRGATDASHAVTRNPLRPRGSILQSSEETWMAGAEGAMTS